MSQPKNLHLGLTDLSFGTVTSTRRRTDHLTVQVVQATQEVFELLLQKLLLHVACTVCKGLNVLGVCFFFFFFDGLAEAMVLITALVWSLPPGL